MYRLSKIVGVFTEPAFLFGFLLLFCLFLTCMPRYGLKRLGRLGVFFLSLALIACMALPLGAWALQPLENRFAHEALPAHVDGLVMLTGDENPTITEARKIPIGGMATPRYVHLARLAKKYPQAKIVIAGNTRLLYPSRAVTTKDISKDLLAQLGLTQETRNIVFEDESRNTYENAVFAAKLVQPGPKERWVLVTSASHMPRSMLVFEKVGWKMIPAPSDYLTDGIIKVSLFPHMEVTLRHLSIAAHEYAGLVSYWLMGWTARLWP
ncbi:MAG: YdcF family protein [Alphaproteobacteria bacterium]|nr:YdcF family protein [Alphaproteobacteria bacterium]